MLPETLAEDQFGIAFRENDIALGLEIQKILEEIISDGTGNTISTK